MERIFQGDINNKNKTKNKNKHKHKTKQTQQQTKKAHFQLSPGANCEERKGRRGGFLVRKGKEKTRNCPPR
jgi:hypothetical protein